MKEWQVKLFIYIIILDSGHYYTYIKDFTSNKWFKFNDTRVTEEKEEKVF